MNNDQLIRDFEQDASSDAAFHHADHVRLAFAYLSEYPILEALSRFCDALKRYAAARGKRDLYHETITWAYFFLIRERMTAGSNSNWDEFAKNNSDLLTWKGGIMGRYYDETTLKSDLARKVFVMPDKFVDPPVAS